MIRDTQKKDKEMNVSIKNSVKKTNQRKSIWRF